jgi:chitin disaccharide deacetylase
MSELLERLGFSPDARVVIVSVDGLGFSYEANLEIYEALGRGRATSASLMLPAPWSRHAAACYRGEDVGVQLVLNSEYDLYRWGPLTHAPSLLDGEGAFPRTVADVWEHADLDEVRREWRAQIARAIQWGIGVDHLDVHLTGLELKPEFLDVYLDLAEEHSLPVRLPDESAQRQIGFPVRELARERGLVFPDRVLVASALGSTVAELRRALRELPAGVTEIAFRPVLDSPELRVACRDWQAPAAQAELLGDGPLLEEGEGVKLIGYRALARLMRP